MRKLVFQQLAWSIYCRFAVSITTWFWTGTRSVAALYAFTTRTCKRIYWLQCSTWV